MQAVYSFMLDSLIMIQITSCFRKGHLEKSVVILGTGKFSAILMAKTTSGYKGINLYPKSYMQPGVFNHLVVQLCITQKAGFHFMVLILITGEK